MINYFKYILIKPRIYILLFLISIIGSCSSSNVSDATKPNGDNGKVLSTKQIINNADWTVTEVSESIKWKYFHFADLFNSKQSVTLFDINLDDEPEINIQYVKSGFLRTTDAAVSARAVTAINGSYFNTESGGSTVYLKKDGNVINNERKVAPFKADVAFTFSKDGEVSIVKQPTSGWDKVKADNILASGPLLLYNNKIIEQLDKSHTSKRHPRTAVCITNDNHLIAAVVDGRANEARGMTTKELAIVMEILECADAMNLDGGGSSTAWVKNHGVVNHPSDNKKFDHNGERGVATVLTFGK